MDFFLKADQVILINILNWYQLEMAKKKNRQKLINITFQAPSAPAESDHTCPPAQGGNTILSRD